MEVHVELVFEHLDRARYRPALHVPGDPFNRVPRELVDRARELDALILTDDLRAGAALTRRRHLTSMARMLRREGAAVLHVHTSQPDRPRIPFVAARLARTPAVVRTEHLPPSQHPAQFSPRVVRVFDAMTDAVVTVSEQNRDEQIATLGRRRAKLRVLYNGIVVDSHEGCEVAGAKQALGLDPAVPVVGTVGRLFEQKGTRFLVEAMRTVVDQRGAVNTLIVGDGPLRDELTARTEALGLAGSVRFVGATKSSRHFVAAFDVAVLPSLYEGFALTMLEFMAAAKPCVFTAHPSFLEGTDHGRVAKLVPPGDVPALAAAIVESLDDPDGARQLGIAARRHVIENFSIEHHLEELMALYDELVAGEPRRSGV